MESTLPEPVVAFSPQPPPPGERDLSLDPLPPVHLIIDDEEGGVPAAAHHPGGAAVLHPGGAVRI